jgi:two-component system sensor histidine kinase ResE
VRRSNDAEEQAELLEATEAEVSRLNRMVNNLLYMAQMEAGLDLKPVLRPVELDSLLLEVFARARSIAAMKNQKVVLSHEDIGMTLGDRDQLQHLLLNLVDNAIKYTPEGGTISLGLWSEGEWSRLEVTDNGQGIPEAELPHVFERFYRTQEARKSARHGSGLGLAIARSITEGHGGRIEVFSRVEEGTTFRLWLRKPQAQLAAEKQQGTGTLLTRSAGARLGA